MEIIRDFSLRRLNTFGIEAFAREFVEVKTDEEMFATVSNLKTGSKQHLFLGGGSNILFTGDYPGLVIKVATKGREIIKEDDDSVVLRVAAGEEWDELVGYTVEQGWSGLENLSGIPGLAGSSPIQNIGAYGTELKDHFESLEGINLCTGEAFTYDAEHCQFGYRDSIFKRALKGRTVITHVSFRLSRKPVFNLTYTALKQKLDLLPPGKITLQKVREAVVEIRSSKLPDPGTLGNAGSFFKNPMVRQAKLEELKREFPAIVYFNLTPHPPLHLERGAGGEVAGCKLAAGWLIEQCGWKGFREGDAGVHRDQALVLVNYGQAKGMELLELAGKIQRSVKEKFGVVLEKEVNIV